MTEFTGAVTVDGVPLGGQGIPATFGTVFYVNSNSGEGNDDFTGLSMDRPKATVLAAYNLTTDGAHDVVVMSGNTAHTFTAELVVSKSRVHFVGLGLGSRYLGQRTRWEMSTGGGAHSGIVRVTGVGCTFSNIKIFNTDTSTSFAVVDTGEYTQWTNVEMVNTVNLGTVTDAHLLCAVDSGYYLRCSIGSSQVGHATSGSRGNVLFKRDVYAGKVARDTIFEDCIFPIEADSATGASCMLFAGGADATQRILWLKNCVFYGSILSDGIDRAIQMDTNQTNGDILLQNCIVHGIDDLCDDSTSAVFHNSPIGVQLGTVSVEGGET